MQPDNEITGEEYTSGPPAKPEADKFFAYKSNMYSCKHCGWTGLGCETIQGEMFRYGIELDCPKCHERFPGLIEFPIYKRGG
jgi:hypothetical protein